MRPTTVHLTHPVTQRAACGARNVPTDRQRPVERLGEVTCNRCRTLRNAAPGTSYRCTVCDEVWEDYTRSNGAVDRAITFAIDHYKRTGHGYDPTTPTAR